MSASVQAGQHLLGWVVAWPEGRWAVEGASRLGRGIAQLLVAAGEPVVDAPAKLAARARLLGTSSARKTDLADAYSVATAALHHRRLRQVALEDHTDVFRLRRIHPMTVVDLERKRIARELLADVRRLDREITTAGQAIRTPVRENGTTLTQVFGVGPVLAARLVGHTGDIIRFPDRDHFASYTGTARWRPPAGMGAAIG